MKRLIPRIALCIAAALAVSLVLRPSDAADDTGTWVRLADMPLATQEVGVAAAGGRVYVVGGTAAGAGLTSNVWAYDPATDTWDDVAPLPGPPRDHIGVASVGGRVYAFGGLTGWPGPSVPDVYEYTPATNTWAPKASIPDPRPRQGVPNRGRGAVAVAVIGADIYVVGGLNGAGGTDSVALRTLARYTPATNTWAPLPDMPTARDHLAAVALGGKLYAVGGRNVQIDAGTGANEVYDPATGQWKALAPLPEARGGLGAGVIGGEVVVFGGEGPGRTGWIWAATGAYDPVANSWRPLSSMGIARHGTGGATLGGMIYVPGGGEEPGGGAESVANERFSLATPEPALEPLLFIPYIGR